LKSAGTVPYNDVNKHTKVRRQTERSSEEISEKYEEALPDEFSHLTDANIINGSIGAEALLEEVISTVKGEGTAVLRFLLLSLSLSAITAICNALCNDAYPLATRAASLIALFLIVGNLMPLAERVTTVLLQLSDFLLTLLPLLTGISVSQGHLSVATSQATAMSLTLSFFGGEGARALSSIVKCLFVLAIVSAFSKEGGKLMNTLKSIFTWGIGIITTLLGGVMSVQTLIGRSADNATMLATKYAISNMLPIAGGTVSGALSTLVSGMSYYAGIVGGGAIAVIVLSAISPLVTLLMYKLALSVVMIFTAFVDGDAVESGIKSVSGALDSLIALYSVTVLIYVFETMIFLRQGMT
jgi:hypothetical protein